MDLPRHTQAFAPQPSWPPTVHARTACTRKASLSVGPARTASRSLRTLATAHRGFVAPFEVNENRLSFKDHQIGLIYLQIAVDRDRRVVRQIWRSKNCQARKAKALNRATTIAKSQCPSSGYQ